MCLMHWCYKCIQPPLPSSVSVGLSVRCCSLPLGVLKVTSWKYYGAGLNTQLSPLGGHDLSDSGRLLLASVQICEATFTCRRCISYTTVTSPASLFSVDGGSIQFISKRPGLSAATRMIQVFIGHGPDGIHDSGAQIPCASCQMSDDSYKSKKNLYSY